MMTSSTLSQMGGQKKVFSLALSVILAIDISSQNPVLRLNPISLYTIEKRIKNIFKCFQTCQFNHLFIPA